MKYVRLIFVLFLGSISCTLQERKASNLDINRVLKEIEPSKQNNMKSLDELIDTNDSAFPLLEEMISEATYKIEVLPRNKEKAEACLLVCQVPIHSFMGTIVYHTRGILIDNGWLRVLGSGSDRMSRSIVSWNKGKSYTQSMSESTFLLIADDALGGFLRSMPELLARIWAMYTISHQIP